MLHRKFLVVDYRSVAFENVIRYPFFVLDNLTLFQVLGSISSKVRIIPISKIYPILPKSNKKQTNDKYFSFDFRWYKFIEGTTRKQAVVLSDRVKQVSGTLIIKDAIVEDSGKYLCVVNNSVGGESVETVLTVTAPLSAKIDPPTQTVDFGRPAIFTCHFSGNPIKTVSWMKDGKSIGHTDAILRIESVKKEDKGMYQCFIRNDQESAEASAELKLGGRCNFINCYI